jgi:hypothetical protein
MRLIDADKVGKVLTFRGESIGDYNIGVKEGLDVSRQVVENAPTIDAAPVVRGEWIYEPRTFNCNPAFKCSNCGHREYEHDRKTLYCPNCGAKMESEGST